METTSRVLHPWFVTGFSEGQATYTFSRSGAGLNLFFAIKLTAADRPLLEDLRAYFGVGRLYDVKAAPPRGPRQGYTKAACYYRVARLGDLEVIVRHFDQYPLQGARRRPFEIWRRMVQLKRDHFRRPPTEQLAALARDLSASLIRNQTAAPPLASR
jgi:LAGLIDADG DNA endonuclease family protein